MVVPGVGAVLGVTAVGAGAGAVVAGGCDGAVVCTPGGVCGAGCCVPGGVCGLAGALGRAVGGTVCCCSVPGGRVASVCGLGVEGVEGFCVEDCALSAVETTKGSPIFLKAALRATVFAVGWDEAATCASSEDLSAGDVDLSAGDGEVFAPALSDAFASASSCRRKRRCRKLLSACSSPPLSTRKPSRAGSLRQARSQKRTPRSRKRETRRGRRRRGSSRLRAPFQMGLFVCAFSLPKITLGVARRVRARIKKVTDRSR